jgi:hypothetical protein
MRITLNIDEEQKELVFNLLNSNNVNFEVEEDFEVPEWQMEESKKRMKEYKKSPAIAIPMEGVLNNLRNRVKL